LSSRLARFDRRLARGRRISLLAGVDEVGRGCLAGPVVVAAVVLPLGCDLGGVDDSKRMTARARERAFLRIRAAAVDWTAVCVSAAEVDHHNVLAASLLGMERAVARLRAPVDLVLVDGNRVPTGLRYGGLALVGGDGRSLSIAAASVVAKVLRDTVMKSWNRRYPGYGFDRNVGYPTLEHRRALARFGPCPLHRRSFAPVRQTLSAQPALAKDSLRLTGRGA
jgi:ribonuclease HII